MVNIKRSTGRRIFSDLSKDAGLIEDLAALCRALRSSSLFIEAKAQLTEVTLANLLSNLRSHYEAHYGKESARPRPIVIPPVTLFMDFRLGGAVHVMLATLLEGATVRDLQIDKLFDYPPSLLLPLLHEIEKNLQLHGLLLRPIIFLNRVPVGIINKLSKITLEHGGRLVSCEEKATHVVDWNEEVDTAGMEGEDGARIVSFLSISSPNDHARVHFLYYPDSFDEVLPLIPNSAPPSTAGVPLAALDGVDQASLLANLSSRKRFQVSCRFILDCDIFNEWGSEIDYDLSSAMMAGVEEEGDNAENASSSVTPSTRRGKAGKRRGPAASGAKARDSLPHQATASLGISGVGGAAGVGTATAGGGGVNGSGATEKLLPDALPASMTNNDQNGMRILDLNPPSLSASAGGAAVVRTVTGQTSSNAIVATPTSALQAVLETSSLTDAQVATRKRKVAQVLGDDGGDAVAGPVAPSSSSSASASLWDLKWLKLDSISPLERRYFPDLLPPEGEAAAGGGDSDSEARRRREAAYRDLRNALIQASALNPGQYLSATESRRKIAGDASRILRVHAFLDAVGAINAKVKTEARPPALEDDYLWSAKKDYLYALLDQRFHHHHLSSKAYLERPTSFFSVELDAALLQEVTNCQGQWDRIASALQQRFPDITPTVEKITPELCMFRYLEMQQQQGQDNGSLSVSAVNGSVPVHSGSTQRHGLGAIEDLALKCTGLLQSFDLALDQLRKEIRGLQSNDEDNSNKVAALESMVPMLTEELQQVVQEAADTIERQGDAFLKDMVSSRLDVLEAKIKVFSRVEALLLQEKERLEIDKRDLLLKQLHANIHPAASSAAALAAAAMGAAGTGSAGLSSAGGPGMPAYR